MKHTLKRLIKNHIIQSRLFKGTSFLKCSPQLSLSDACNFNCVMCWVHSGYARTSLNPERMLFSERPPSVMNYDDFVKIIDGLIMAGVKMSP